LQINLEKRESSATFAIASGKKATEEFLEGMKK
jgi:hypothetical protein